MHQAFFETLQGAESGSQGHNQLPERRDAENPGDRKVETAKWRRNRCRWGGKSACSHHGCWHREAKTGDIWTKQNLQTGTVIYHAHRVGADGGGLMMNAAEPFPELSWSWTRNQAFLNCKRSYFHAYYSSWGGWRREASNLSRHAYRLKRLVTLDQLFGISVHNQIHRMMDESQKMTVEEFAASIRKALNRAFWDSKHKQEEWYEQPSDINMLQEMYYDGELPEQKIEEYRERITVIANHLLSSQTLMDIFERKDKVKLITSERFRLFEMEGIKVWVVLDLVFQDLESGKFVVVDFKTGKPSSSDKVQLLLYALFLKEAFHLSSLDQIELRNEYLATGKHASFTPRQTDLEYVQSLIRTSVKEMKAYLRVPEQNVPLDMERFEQTKNRAICRRCAFRELCDRG